MLEEHTKKDNEKGKASVFTAFRLGGPVVPHRKENVRAQRRPQTSQACIRVSGHLLTLGGAHPQDKSSIDMGAEN